MDRADRRPMDAPPASRFPPALWLLVPPLAVFVLSAAIFSTTGFGIESLVREIIQALAGAPQPVDRFAEFHARLNWAATILLVYCTLIAAMIYSIRIVYQHRSDRGKFMMVLAGVVTVSVVLAYFAYSGRAENDFSYIFLFTYDTLEASRIYSRAQLHAVRLLLFGLNALAGIVPILGLVTAGCCVLAPPMKTDETGVEHLKMQMRVLKTIVGLGSALMVAGVVHMVAWLSWPAALLQEQRGIEAISDFAQAMGLYWGVTFSLVIAAFYLPAAFAIHRRAEACYRAGATHADETEVQAWLRQNGLAMAPAQQFPAFLAMFAPLLAEPIGSLLARVSGSPLMG